MTAADELRIDVSLARIGELDQYDENNLRRIWYGTRECYVMNEGSLIRLGLIEHSQGRLLLTGLGERYLYKRGLIE